METALVPYFSIWKTPTSSASRGESSLNIGYLQNNDRMLVWHSQDCDPNSLSPAWPGDLLALPRSDCIAAEQLCLSDSTCNGTYRILESCALAKTRSPPLDHDSRVRCLNAELDLGNSSLLHCKCHRRMKRQEHCLRIFWTVHSSMTDGEMSLQGASKAHPCPVSENSCRGPLPSTAGITLEPHLLVKRIQYSSVW